MSLADLMLLVPSRCGITEEPNPSIPFILVNLGQSSSLQRSGSCNTQMICNQTIQRAHCIVIHNRER